MTPPDPAHHAVLSFALSNAAYPHKRREGASFAHVDVKLKATSTQIRSTNAEAIMSETDCVGVTSDSFGSPNCLGSLTISYLGYAVTALATQYTLGLGGSRTGDMASGWKHPRLWLRINVQKKHYLFFVCPVSQEVVSRPIKLEVATYWFRKAAPVLASGLLFLQTGWKESLNMSLNLDGDTKETFEMTPDHIREILYKLSDMLDETGHSGLLDRLQSQELSDRDVRARPGRRKNVRGTWLLSRRSK